MPESPTPEQDPVVNSSLSGLLLISSLVVFLTLVWALADETYFLRPWKGYQARFVTAYTKYLKRLQPVQGRSEETIRKTATYQELDSKIKETQKAAAPEVERINKEIREIIQPRLADLTSAFQSARSELSALNYDLETASPGSKPSIQKKIDAARARRIRLTLLRADGSGQTERVDWNFPQLEQEYQRLKDRQAELVAQLVRVNAPESELRQKLAAYVKEQLTGLTREQIQGLIDKMDIFKSEIKQIHIKEVDLVDRCESCHLGTREPVELTKAAMGGEAAFTSHPTRDLLKIHDPERFGCTPCHNGNGIATSSVEKGHGNYPQWL